MNKQDITQTVAAINQRQMDLQVLDNNELRTVVQTCDIIDVFAAVKEFARRLSLDDVEVSPTELDIALAEDDKCDFIEISDDKAIYHHKWKVYNDSLEWNMVHYDEQLEAGILMHYGYAVEMATGEGKTLAATLPVVLNGLLGKNVHLMTVNSYLSRRDYELTRPIYAFWGLSSGCIEMFEYREKGRKDAYKSNVVFGTNSVFAWDYLRDHLAVDASQIHQTVHDYAIIDELDSVLVDDAVNPHIIGGVNYYSQEGQYRLWKQAIEELLKDATLYDVDKARAKVKLTQKGEEWIAQRNEWKGCEALYPKENTDYKFYWSNVHQQLLNAYILYTRDADYIVYEGRVVIVDPSTGRRKDSSRWEYGLHTAVEVKENVMVKRDFDNMAVISIKNYLRLYEKCAGMSGTILSVEKELQESYGLKVAKIPTHKPCIRKDEPLRIYKNENAKNKALAQYVHSMHVSGRPVLIGCRDMIQSQKVAEALDDLQLKFELLDARDFGLESFIVSQAGKHGSILLSTSMAGRGTDIKPDKEAIEAGGLAVVAADLFYSNRVDDQLRGRTGRQGNPGSSVIFSSIDDLLVDYLSPEEQEQLKRVSNEFNSEEITCSESQNLMQRAQQNRDSYFASLRKENARKDDAIAPHRKEFYRLRQNILCSNDDSINELLNKFLPSKESRLAFDILCKSFHERASGLTEKPEMGLRRGDVFSLPLACVPDTFVIIMNIDTMKCFDYFRTQMVKQIVLQVYDKGWSNFVEYLMQQLSSDQIDSLEDNSVMRIKEMDELIGKRLLGSSIPVNVRVVEKRSIHRSEARRNSADKTAMCPNDICPCGSGKPFAQCHGAREYRKRR